MDLIPKCWNEKFLPWGRWGVSLQFPWAGRKEGCGTQVCPIPRAASGFLTKKWHQFYYMNAIFSLLKKLLKQVCSQTLLICIFVSWVPYPQEPMLGCSELVWLLLLRGNSNNIFDLCHLTGPDYSANVCSHCHCGFWVHVWGSARCCTSPAAGLMLLHLLGILSNFSKIRVVDDALWMT